MSRIAETINLAQRFMEMKELDVVDRFTDLPGAQVIPFEDNMPVVFIPPTRKESVLLMAHYDTKFKKRSGVLGPYVEDDIKVRVNGFVLESAIKGVGIGADDRLGCAACWSCRKMGHGIILFPEEEVGCRGSKFMVDNHLEVLKGFQFMLQFDRAGARDLAMYNHDSEPFLNFLKSRYPQYNKVTGSSTDVKQLVVPTKTCGVNVSIGFKAQHTENETADILDYMRTVGLTQAMLRMEDIPKFTYFPPVYHSKADKKPSGYTTYPSKYDRRAEAASNKAAKQAKKRERATWKNSADTWGTPVSPGTTNEPTKAKELAIVNGAASPVDRAVEKFVSMVDLQRTGDEVDGFDCTAMLTELGAIVCDPLGNKALVKMTPQQVTDLKTEPLKVAKLYMFANTDTRPCRHCKANIPVALQIMLMNGNIQCGICHNMLVETPAVAHRRIITAHEELLHDYNVMCEKGDFKHPNSSPVTAANLK